jgi:predicted DNA-binding transcriptional regulator AlpA
MTGPPHQTALDETFRAFLDLSFEHQLELARRVGEFLALSKEPGVALDDELAQKRETLACIRRAQEHLGLTRPPTVKEYAEASAALELPWSWQRISRLWGTWLRAIQALSEGRVPKSASARSYRSRHHGRKRTRAAHWTALRRWLDSAPARLRMVDYDDYAREYNQMRADSELPLPRAGTIIGALKLPWRELLAVARGDKTEEEAAGRRRQRRDWSRGPHALISVATIAQMSGGSESAAAELSRRFEFPRPVGRFGGCRAWLLEEVATFLGGEAVPRREENRLRHLYLDVHEYAAAVGRSIAAAQSASPDVERAGMVGGNSYWLASEVEDWVARNAHVVAERKARIERPGVGPAGGENDFVTTGVIAKRLGLTQYKADKLVRGDGFPAPVLVVVEDRVWSWPQVKAHLTGQPLPAAPALAEKLIEADVLSETLALSRGTTFPSRTTLPPPWMRVGMRQIWHADRVDEWIAALPERDRARINRRRAKRGLEPL